MPELNWEVFNSLSGSKYNNFEQLCHSIISLQFRKFGEFRSLKNQPGVEFHLRLTENSQTLGDPPRWYG